ncbi:hypothetical protein PPACK8108_LOCUS17528 [Phakopsora pachyrhizi]|uniref:Uncharacterized protein n=1 Tax=Phakopsora pachyrhizi TaxID=170000 RepID=A0AAV0B7W2_PHAPC|nr:hypothetical protein PPACK8108_LOCUS15436 [Phakopsora pachyrhizi]CAH7683798.1 hypothetical protein PPACK8108_LOCUS17528 [Phakopsora pachyrhizi]
MIRKKSGEPFFSSLKLASLSPSSSAIFQLPTPPNQTPIPKSDLPQVWDQKLNSTSKSAPATPNSETKFVHFDSHLENLCPSSNNRNRANIYLINYHHHHHHQNQQLLSPVFIEIDVLNALLSHNLGISDYKTLPESLYPSEKNGQIIFGNHASDVSQLRPAQECERAYSNGIGGEVLDNLKGWVDDWEGADSRSTWRPLSPIQASLQSTSDIFRSKPVYFTYRPKPLKDLHHSTSLTCSYQTSKANHLNKTSGGELDQGQPHANGINRNRLKSKVENRLALASRVIEDVKMKSQPSSCSFAPVSNDHVALSKAISVPLPPDDKPFPSDHEVNHATAGIKLAASHPFDINQDIQDMLNQGTGCSDLTNQSQEIQGIKPPNQSSITDKSKSNKEQDYLVRLREDEEIHTGPGLKMPRGEGRMARWKAVKELHSKATECHESAIQAQGQYEKE